MQLILLYGSQTGNSHDLAERIWRQATLLNLQNTQISSLNEYDVNSLNNSEQIILIVCSTTGQGDVPDNMLKFWKFIMRKNLPLNCLENLRFSVIGLGDSSYAKYNYTAKKLFKRLIQLGGTPVLDVCLCDEQGSYENTFSLWVKQFWSLFGIDDTFIELRNKSNDMPYLYEVLDVSDVEENVCEEVPNDAIYDEFRPYISTLTANNRVTTNDHWQDVRLIEFQANLKYAPGDVLMLKPQNSQKHIQLFYDTFQHLNLNPKKKIKIQLNSDKTKRISTNIETVNDLVEKYFDLNSVPRLSFFQTFCKYSYVNELENEKLNEFINTKDGLEDLYEYCHRPRRNIIEVFSDFSNTTKNIKNLNDLINLIPEIKPRAFSIASNHVKHVNKIQILVALVEYKTRLYETRRGTCSTWLKALTPNLQIPIWIKKGTFDIDACLQDRPLICIGPGTGVAPFRNIIYERVSKYNYNNNYLYFGCRSKLKDYYFENDWIELHNEGSLNVYTAFSRDQDVKIYVQDKMLENSKDFFNLVFNLNAVIFIAGNSKRMPEDVLETLRKIIENEYRELNSNDETIDYKLYSENFMKKLELNKRIQLETWS